MEKFFAGVLVFLGGLTAYGQSACEVANTNAANLISYCSSLSYNCTENGMHSPIIRYYHYGPQSSVYSIRCQSLACGTSTEYWYYWSNVDIPKNCGSSSGPASGEQAGGPRQGPPKPVNQCGSIVQTETQVLGESIPLMGISFDLNYFSSWAPGRVIDYKYTTPISNSSVRAQTSGFEIWIYDETNALKANQVFNNGPDQNYSYTWDGLNSLGAETWGSVSYKVRLKEYSSDHSPDFNVSIIFGSLKAKKLGLGGWAPSIWQFYDLVSGTLYGGNGSTRKVSATAISGGYRVAEQDGSVVYFFDSLGRITHTKTGLIGTTIYTFSYDGNGHLESITEPFGRITTFNRNILGVFTSITAPNGQVTNVSLDGNGNLSSVTNSASETFSMIYVDAKGLLATFTKPSLAVSTFTYDSLGRLEDDEHSGGFSLALGGVYGNQTLTSAMGRQTAVTWNSNNSAYSQKHMRPDGSTLLIEYSSPWYSHVTDRNKKVQKNFELDVRFGEQVQALNNSTTAIFGNRLANYTQAVTLSNAADPFSINTLTKTSTTGASTVTSVYTGSNKTWTTSSQMGRTKTVTLDSYERVTTSQIGNQNASNYIYTNEFLTQIQQGTRITNLNYNLTSKLLTSMANGLSEATSYGYDSAQRLSTVTLPDMRVIYYSYDFLGNLRQITPASRPMHLFSLNSKELIGSYEPPALDLINNYTTTYSYNNDKQLTQIYKPNGDTLNYNYGTNTGALDSISGIFGSLTYTYFSGVLSGIRDASNNTIGIYNMNGVPYYLQYGYGNFSGYYQRMPNTHYANLGTEYVYGNTGDRAISYTYDTDELLTGAGSLILNYDIPNGNLTGTTLDNVTDEYTYNNYGEVTGYVAKYSGAAIYSYTLARDALGRVSQKVETSNGVTTTFDYDYDVAGRLIEVKKNTVIVATYDYDDNSNRDGGIIGGTTTSATYDVQDRLNTYNVNDYVYDRNGTLQTKTNTLLSQTSSYIYDVFGNLKSVTLPSSDVITYEIDPMNRRFGRKLNGVLQKRYMHNFENQLIAEFDSTNKLKKRYVYGTQSNSPDYFVDDVDDKYRVIKDHLGSVRLIVKSTTGAVMQRMEHDEFGRVVADTNPGYTPFGFAGGFYDSDTKLVRFGARDYDPEIGRWTSKDPILFDGGTSNLYGYSFSDPVNFVDSNGKHPVLALGAIIVGGGLVGGIASASTAYALGGSIDEVMQSGVGGFFGGAAATTAGLAAAVGVVPTMAGVGIGVAVDFAINFATAPGVLPEGTGKDFGNGIKTLVNPKKDPVCP